MIEAKNGKWATEDGQAFDSYEDAVLHKRAFIREEAIAAGCKTEAEIKQFRKRYWVKREAAKREKEKNK